MNHDISTYMPIIIFGIILIVVIAVIFGIKQSAKKSEKKYRSHRGGNKKEMNIKVNSQFITKKEYTFLTMVHKALPSDFIAFPRIALSNLVVPTSDKIVYNLVSNKVADVCVFNKDTMQPVLVVDLVETEVSSFSFNEMDELAKKALSAVKIPVVEINIQMAYDVPKLRKALLDAMPATVVAMIKENILK